MAALREAVGSVKLCGPNLPRVLNAYCITTTCSTHDVVKDQRDNLTAYKRGKGGRGSFSGVVATVFGAPGFLGHYVVSKLGKIGSQIICPYRGDPYFVRDLKLAGELGQVLFLPFHLNDEDSIRKCMKYSNVVINLVGRDWETKNFKFNDVHVDGARRLARIARECGVERFIHVSHLNADPEPPSIYVKGGSEFLKSKHYGEQAVREEFPDATIFRPADIFGLEDRFIQYYASPWRRAHGRMPLWKKGEQTVKRPVFCFNVAEGIVNSLNEPRAIGNTYECVGPNSYLLSDLVDYFYRCLRWNSIRRTYVSPLFKLKVMYMSYAPSTPILTLDKLDREHVSDVLRDYETLEDLGVKLTRIEERAAYELKPYRLYNYYDEHVGEFADPDPPPILS